MNSLPVHPINLNKVAAIFTALTIVSAWLIPSLFPVAAASFNEVIVRLDRMSDSTATGGRVCATPSAANLANTEASVQVTFPTGFTVNTTATNWTVNTSNLDTGQTAWPGVGTATNVSGQVVTFPSGNLSSSSTLYCFNFAASSTLTTPGSTGNNLTGTVATRTAGLTTVDSSQYATSIIADDQI